MCLPDKNNLLKYICLDIGACKSKIRVVFSIWICTRKPFKLFLNSYTNIILKKKGSDLNWLELLRMYSKF